MLLYVCVYLTSNIYYCIILFDLNFNFSERKRRLIGFEEVNWYVPQAYQGLSTLVEGGGHGHNQYYQ